MFANRLLFVCLALFIAADAWAGLDIQRWTTPQGARVYFVENHDLPMLDVNVGFAAGSAYDSPEKAGLGGLTQSLMSLGAGAWNEQQVAERLADVGAQMGGYFEQDRAGFTLRTLSSAKERDQALSVLDAVLARPAFPEAVLEREKARAIAGLKEAATKPEYLADRAFTAAIYPGHPYGVPADGSIETVAKLTRADLVAFHDRYYRAADMAVAIMGDIDRAGAEKLATSLAADLPQGAAPLPLPRVADLAAGRQLVIPHPASQSHILIGQPGMTRDDPDYFPLLVGNYVLGGGGFDSRLIKEVRQKRGLSYSVYSYFMPLADKGPFQLGLQTRREATDEALKVVRDTLTRYLAEGPTDAELKQAKDNLVGGFPLRLDSNGKILSYLAMMDFYRLPPDWLDTYPKKVAAVTREEVVKAMRARLKPANMVTVIVGGQRGTGDGK
ncbi:MAG: pitrilysin family protein [Parasulfuritortus sp.]|jgi:zinc protease|nr:pitrilysin family protein [Parasulfuritortus sp.]